MDVRASCRHSRFRHGAAVTTNKVSSATGDHEGADGQASRRRSEPEPEAEAGRRDACPLRVQPPTRRAHRTSLRARMASEGQQLYLQRDQPPGVPPLALTGERTLPDVPEENYWFRRHLVVYEWIAEQVPGRHVVDVAS